VRDVCASLFGARAQVVVGIGFLIATLFQAWLWGIHSAPSKSGIFWLSIEALLFASYGVVATGLGYRKTEHVEAKVVENIEQVDDVHVER
jgi:hypothetical protein